MNEDKNMVYVDNSNIEQYLIDKEIWLFGAGLSGEDFIKTFGDKVSVAGFIDNFPKAEEKNGLQVLKLEQWDLIRKKDSYIVVTSDYYGKVIAEQLIKEGLHPFDDFIVWDNKCIFHKDDNINDFIRFNERLWSKEKIEDTDNIVILPYEGIHDSSTIVRAYCINYLAQKYNAKIIAYIREGRKVDSITDSLWDVYKSFNVVGAIDESLTEEQQERVEQLVEDIWPTLHTYDDWYHNIEIYGINFGRTILRHYLRVYIPTYTIEDIYMKDFLREAVSYIVYWYDYLTNHSVKAMILEDGVSREGYARDIACKMGIDVYVTQNNEFRKLTMNNSIFKHTKYYKKFWNELSESEKAKGKECAKNKLQARLTGNSNDVYYPDGKSPFSVICENRILENNDKIKVLICPHIFEEDSYHGAWQLFNNYFSWLVTLGELSEKTDYEWYIKKHPAGSWRDDIIIDEFLRRYSKIKEIPKLVSARQLRDEGLQFALTVCGTIGHEYAALGVQVINAGDNPHIAYDFNWNPQTKKEYIHLLLNLHELDKKIDMDEIYEYFAIHFLYYDDINRRAWKAFYMNPELTETGLKKGTNKYRLFMEECDDNRHQEIKKNVEELFEFVDNWKENEFYKTNENS